MATVDSDQQFLFILSRKAGDGRSANFRELILETFRKYRMDGRVAIKVTGQATDTSDFAREFARRHGDRGVVFVVGGDGSVNEVATAIVGTGCAMGVIPAGTGNDFSRILYNNRKTDIADLILGIPFAEVKPFDLIRVNMEDCHPPDVRNFANTEIVSDHFQAYCINVLSFGLDTAVLNSALHMLERNPRLKGMAYFLGVMANLVGRKRYPIRFELNMADGGILKGENDNCVLGAVCNGGFYGNGFNPAPMAKPDDGILQLTLADWMGGWNFLKLIRKYHKGTHVGHKDIQIMDITGGTFESKTGERFLANYDGIVFAARRFSFEIMPAVLPFVIPRRRVCP